MVSIEEQFKYIHNLSKNIKSLYLYYNYNINKLPNTFIKLNGWWNDYKYLNNLPLNVKYLQTKRVNYNLPPNIIYLNCYYCDIYNLPRSLEYIYYNTIINNKKFIIPKELFDYNKNKFLNYYYYENIIKLKSIY